ncbi:XapX domain protein containing protein [Herbaspirillum sp. YR522]|nr:XapX domain protein containing protein [Herbaspirillum sp. YR522]
MQAARALPAWQCLSAFKADIHLLDTMNSYLLSLAGGVLIGIFYALLRVRSPAPPGIALVGLLGMVLGERAISALTPYLG